MIYAFLLRHWRVLVVVCALLALYGAYRWHVASQIEQARADDAAEAQRMDSVADDVAGQVAAARASQFAKDNDDARKAAIESDDPLRAGLDRLRASKGGDGEASPRPAEVRR